MRLGRFLIGLVVLLSFFPVVLPLQVRGVSGVGSDFHFYISEPQIIRFPQMYIRIVNNEETPLIISLASDVPEGFNVKVFFEFNTTYLEPQESRMIHYWFDVQENFELTALVSIRVKAEIAGQTDPILVHHGIIFHNRISYFAETKAHFLTVKVSDRDESPRFAEITILFQPNSSVPWTPMKQINATQIQGFFPQGNYLVHAIDLETRRVGEVMFGLSEPTEIIVPIYLVGFGYFEFVHPEFNNGSGKVVLSAYNYLEELHDTYIYAELYQDDQLVVASNKDYREIFGKTTSLAFTFHFEQVILNAGNYSVIGRIDSLERTIIDNRIQFDQLIQYIPPALRIDNFLSLLFFGGFVVFAGLFVIQSVYYRRKRK